MRADFFTSSRLSLLSLLFSLAAVAACTPAPRGPKTPIAERPVAIGLTIALDGAGVETLADGTTRMKGHGATPFRIVVVTKVDRHPHPGERVLAVLTSGERVVKQQPFTFDAVRGRVAFDVPAPGTYRIEIWQEDRFILGNTFVAAALPALDGTRALELHQDASPRLAVRPTGTSELIWNHWDAIDADVAFAAEWWRDGKRVGSAGAKRSELQREVLAKVQNAVRVEQLGDLPAWKWTTEKFPLPVGAVAQIGVGHWELRVYREDRPPLALGFDVNADGSVRGTQKRTVREGRIELDVSPAPASKTVAKEMAALPRTRFMGSKRFLLPVMVAEARALTRSDVLRNQRVRLNALSRQMGGDSSGTMQFGGQDASPQAVEARTLVASMQKLIASLGTEWADDEKP